MIPADAPPPPQSKAAFSRPASSYPLPDPSRTPRGSTPLPPGGSHRRRAPPRWDFPPPVVPPAARRLQRDLPHSEAPGGTRPPRLPVSAGAASVRATDSRPCRPGPTPPGLPPSVPTHAERFAPGPVAVSARDGSSPARARAGPAAGPCSRFAPWGGVRRPKPVPGSPALRAGSSGAA